MGETGAGSAEGILPFVVQRELPRLQWQGVFGSEDSQEFRWHRSGSRVCLRNHLADDRKGGQAHDQTPGWSHQGAHPARYD